MMRGNLNYLTLFPLTESNRQVAWSRFLAQSNQRGGRV